MLNKILMRALTALTLLLCACSGLPHKVYPAVDTFQRAQVFHPRVALVLGGGGARGVAHLGVLKALEEANIPIDLIVGTSAGSLVGGLYANNPNSDRLKAIMMRCGYSDFFDIALSHLIRGPVLGIQLQRFIGRNTRFCTVENLKIPFIAVATDLNTGQRVCIAKGPLSLAVNASCAIPAVIHPVVCKNVTLVDGGLTSPLPVDVAKEYHPRIIIAVDISSKPMPNLPLSTTTIVLQSLDIMMLTLTSKDLKHADVLIRPDVGSVGIFDLSCRQELYDKGLFAGRKAIPQIRRLLQSR